MMRMQANYGYGQRMNLAGWIAGMLMLLGLLLPVSASAAAGDITTVAGPADSISAKYNSEIGTGAVAVDVAGNIYISDAALHSIHRVDAATGILSTVAGTGVAGGLDDGIAATSARLYYPAGIAVDSAGNIYVAEWQGHRIRKIDAITGIITTAVGVGSPGYSGDGGAATSARLNYPRGLAVDSKDNLYIADSYNNRIRRVDAATGIITTVAGNGGAVPLGDGAAATQANIRTPMDVAVDGTGNLYIVDRHNHRIRRVDAETGIITTVAGNGETGRFIGGGVATLIPLSFPSAVAVDAAGNNLYVTDSFSRIRHVDLGKGLVSTAAGTGLRGFSTDEGAAISAHLSLPSGLAVDSTGNLYIADGSNHRIRRMDPETGIITTVVASAWGYSGDDGAATSARLNFPRKTAMDDSGNLYIADEYNHRIRKVDAKTGIITTVAGNGGAGYSGDSGIATSATLYRPSGVAVDGTGNLYIADQYNHRVRRVDAKTGIITTIAGIGIAGFTAEGGLATWARLRHPRAVAVDSAGNLYIADSGNNRVRRVDGETGIITTVAGNGAYAYAYHSYNDDGGPATLARLAGSADVAVDGAGNLYIVDGGNHRVRRVDAKTGIITTAAGSESWGYSGDGGVATLARLYYPQSVALDDADNLYIADTWNHRVRRVDAKTGIITTVAGSESWGYSGDGAATLATLNAPFGIMLDRMGNLYVSDTMNHRIRKVEGVAASGNKSPIANPGATQMVECTGDSSASVILDGSASSDPDGDPLSYSWTWAGGTATGVNPTASFPLGTTTVTLTVDDGKGGTATAATVVTVQDTTAPTVNAGSDVAIDATSGAGASYDVSARVTAIDSCCGVTTTISPSGPYPLGSTQVTVTATDCSNNSASDTMTVTVNEVNTVPGIMLPGGVSVVVSVPVGSGFTLYNVSGSAAPNGSAGVDFPYGMISFSVASPVGGSVPVTLTFSKPLPTPMMLWKYIGSSYLPVRDNLWQAAGPNSVVVTLTDGGPYDLDGVANGVIVDPIAVAVDAQPPVVIPPVDITIEATGITTNVDLGVASANDNVDGALNFSSDAPATFPLGTTVVTYSATDAAGNTATATQSVTVVDTTAPALTVPVDVTAEANGNPFSSVAIGSASATDIFAVTVTSDAPAAFPLGTTVVTWTAVDANGNSSSGTQNITVVDTTAPVLTVPADVTVEANAVNSSVAIGMATATDLFSVTVNSDAPAAFPLGTTVVTWTATDANGNVSTGTQNVTVVDTTAPVLTVPADASVDANGYPNSSVDLGTATATDIFAVTITNDAPADGFSIGETTVTWTATDANGNSSTATQKVTVDAKLASLLLRKAEVEWREMTDESGVKFGVSEVKAKGTVELPVWLPLSAITPDALITIGLGGVPELLSEQVAFSVKGDKWRYKVKTAVGVQKMEIEWKGSEFKFKDAASGVELESESDDASDTSLSLETKGHDVMLTVNGVTVSVSGGVVTSSYPFDKDEDGEVTFELPFALTPDMVIALTIDGVAQDVAVLDHTTAARGKFELKAEVNAGSMDGTSGNGTLDLGLSLGSVAIDGTDSVSGWSNKSGKEWKVKKRHHK